MKYVRGFLMAWGCFCWIPCPYKKWNEADRAAMVAALPLVGMCMGVIAGLVWWALHLLGVAPVLAGAVMTAAYFLLTGFIHLDGFMDCCDAVLPRHPDPARRREILKDPHNGAFGIVSLVLMAMLFFASAAAMSGELQVWHLIALPVMLAVSRGCSAAAVLSKRPMETSQYGSLEEISRAKAIPARLITALVAAAGILVLVLMGNRVLPGDGALMGNGTLMGVLPGDGGAAGAITALILVIAVTIIAAEVTGAADRKTLGGMSGDISGHMIVTSEMFGMLAGAMVTAAL